MHQSTLNNYPGHRLSRDGGPYDHINPPGYNPTGLGSNDIPPGMLPQLIEKMVQLDDLKALENNTLEMWRAMARYELQKEEEIRESKRRERAELMDLQHENDCLRKEILIRDAQNGLYCNMPYTACCSCITTYPSSCCCCPQACGSSSKKEGCCSRLFGAK